jgi:hypothetical protein
MSGAVVCGLQPEHCIGAGFLDFFFLEDCAEEIEAVAAPTKKINASAVAMRKNFSIKRLVMPDRRVRIFAERACVAFRQDFHEPLVKIIDRMVHDRFEAAVVFAMGFLNVIFQSDANIFVLAAQANLFRPQHFNILHGNFRHPICTSVQFLFLIGKVVNVEVRTYFSLFFNREWQWLGLNDGLWGRNANGGRSDRSGSYRRYVGRSCRYWRWYSWCGTNRLRSGRWSFHGNCGTKASNLGFKRRPLSRLECDSNKSRQDF